MTEFVEVKEEERVGIGDSIPVGIYASFGGGSFIFDGFITDGSGKRKLIIGIEAQGMVNRQIYYTVPEVLPATIQIKEISFELLSYDENENAVTILSTARVPAKVWERMQKNKNS